MDAYVAELRRFIEDLVSGDAHHAPPLKRRRWDRNADSGKGKWRDINEPLLWLDQYVHHAVLQPMIPHIMRSMDKYCIASVPGRGNSYGVKAIKKWMNGDAAGTRYGAECDIYHCFEELDPPYVIQALKRLFKDRETLWLCDALMEYGVLIGAFFSAWFLHLVLQPLDLMILQREYGVSHYLRQDGQLHHLRLQQAEIAEADPGYSGVAGRRGTKAERQLAGLSDRLYPKGGEGQRASARGQTAPKTAKDSVGAGLPGFGHGYTILRKHNLFRLKQSLHLYYYRRDRNQVISFKRASGLISRLGQLRKCDCQRILERYYQPKTMFDLKKVVRKECRRLQKLYPPYQAA